MKKQQDIQGCFPGFGASLDEKVSRAIAILRYWEYLAIRIDPENGYHGCDSGGKDSGCIRELAAMAGVRVVWHYNVTTIDPPELCRFIRREHPDTLWVRRPMHFFAMLSEKRGYPLRRQRWCCAEFKERGGAGKVKITGVRWAESPRRRNMWKSFQQFGSDKKSYLVNPIIDWTTNDVWSFTAARKLPYCELYDEGYKRLGCVGCPMSGTKGVARDFARWPQFERAWRRSFHRLWERRHGQPMIRGKRKGQMWPGLPGIENASQLFEWWKSGLSAPTVDDECQLGLW